MTPEFRKLMMNRGFYREYKKNDIIFKQGAQGSSSFYMIRGHVTYFSKR
jgi:hypothetical protein